MVERPSVLLPVMVLEGESIAEGIPELLENAHVVLLGYHVIPEQTAAGQARMQFEERAEARLEDIETMLIDAGATVETRLVFTHEAQATIDRTIHEHDCLAVLVPSATRPPEEVLVAVRGTVGFDRMARLVGGLFADSDVAVTLLHITPTLDDTSRALLDDLTEQLITAGFDETALTSEVYETTDPIEYLVDTASQYDVAVIGESDPSLITFVFGWRTEEVVERFLCPVLVVQRQRSEEDTGNPADPNGDIG